MKTKKSLPHRTTGLSVPPIFPLPPGRGGSKVKITVPSPYREGERGISATIDRLILTHDAHGRVIAAHIIDFKTNRPGHREGYNRFEDWLMDHYAGQMKEYRKLIAAAFNLSEADINVSLISCPLDYLNYPARVLTYRTD